MASTIVSWALTLSLIGIGIYYYKPDLLKPLSSSPSPPRSASVSELAERSVNKRPKSKKSQVANLAGTTDESATSSSNEAKSGKKRKIVSPSGTGDTTSMEAGPSAGTKNRGNDVDLADKEFAQQLAKTQAGTNLQKSDKKNSGKKNKSLKQTQAATLEPPEITTGASSTIGRDADDDLNPAELPTVQPTSGPSHAGDVSDMMETPAAKPTVLRLSNVPDEKPKKKAASQPFEQVLTKKQRQAQAKKEEIRQMKEESDRIHEAKKQEQLRKARMASGTSNQTKANNFTNNTSNAWQSGKGNAAVKAAPANSAAPLLDTFEPSISNVSHPHGAVQTVPSQAASTAALTTSAREGRRNNSDGALSGNISEEDQMQMLKEQQAEDAWESVTTKKSKKKTKNEIDEPPAVHHQTSTLPRSQPNGTKYTGASTRIEPEANNRFGSFSASQPNSFGDAEWEA